MIQSISWISLEAPVVKLFFIIDMTSVVCDASFNNIQFIFRFSHKHRRKRTKETGSNCLRVLSKTEYLAKN